MRVDETILFLGVKPFVFFPQLGKLLVVRLCMLFMQLVVDYLRCFTGDV